jgi:pilus assembly protein CpaC
MNFKHLSMIIIMLTLFVFNVHSKNNQETIKLHVGAIKTVNVGKVSRVAVGIESLLATSILDNGELLLIPKNAGETDLKIWKVGERLVNLRIIITAGNTASYIDDIRAVIRDFEKVSARSVNGLIVLEGEVTPQRYELFNNVISSFDGVVNKVLPTALVMKAMINFKIQVLEVNKNYAKNVGIAWDRSMEGPNIGFVKNFRTNGRYAVSNGTLGDTLFDSENPIIGFSDESSYSFLGIASSLSSRINLLKEDGAARILAEPQISTRNGEVASFHSGGSYPLAIK